MDERYARSGMTSSSRNARGVLTRTRRAQKVRREAGDAEGVGTGDGSPTLPSPTLSSPRVSHSRGAGNPTDSRLSGSSSGRASLLSARPQR